MSEYLFNVGDTVEFDNRAGAKTQGKIIHRSYHQLLEKNVFYLALDNPLFPVVMLGEEELKQIVYPKKVEEKECS